MRLCGRSEAALRPKPRHTSAAGGRGTTPELALPAIPSTHTAGGHQKGRGAGRPNPQLLCPQALGLTRVLKQTWVPHPCPSPCPGQLTCRQDSLQAALNEFSLRRKLASLSRIGDPQKGQPPHLLPVYYSHQQGSFPPPLYFGERFPHLCSETAGGIKPARPGWVSLHPSKALSLLCPSTPFSTVPRLY